MIKILLLFLMLVSSVFADRDGGPYVGLGFGSSVYTTNGLYPELQEDTSGATAIYVGAYINKHLSVEFSSVSFDARDLEDGFIVDDNKTLRYGANTLSTLAHYAFFNDTLDFYARFGVGEMNMSGVKKNGFAMVVGAGIGIRFNKYISMKVAYDVYNFEYEDARIENDIIAYKMKINYLYSALEVQF